MTSPDKKKYPGDYYPLAFDLADLGCIEGSNPWAIYQNRDASGCKVPALDSPEQILSPLLPMEKVFHMIANPGTGVVRVVFLLAKCSFEAHVYLMHDIYPREIAEEGTTACLRGNAIIFSMTGEFIENLSCYSGEIHEFIKEYDHDYAFDEEGTAYLVKVSVLRGLFRLPVVLLAENRLSSLLPLHDEFRDLRKELYNQVNHLLDTEILVTRVNEEYESRFHKLLLQVNSREEVLHNQKVRLIMAEDPSIHSEVELEKKWFDHLVESELRVFLPGRDSQGMAPGRMVDPQRSCLSHNYSQKLYRFISKCCMEIHTQEGADILHPVLNQFFIMASEVYHKLSGNRVDEIIGCAKLTRLLAGVLVYRRINNLGEVAGMIPMLTAEEEHFINQKEEIRKLTNTVASLSFRLQSLNGTAFRLSQVMDEELAVIHEEWLKSYIRQLDERIAGLQQEILRVVREKEFRKVK